MKQDEEYIKRSVESLEDQFPELSWNEGELWNRIEDKMPTGKRLSFNYKWYAAAASVVLGIMLLNHLLSNEDSSVSINYATTIEVEVEYEIVTTDYLDMETLAFINENCQKDLQICHSPEFKELRSQLDEVSSEINDLNDMISRYGDSPELVKSKIQIENFRSQIMRQLVQIITS